MNPILERCAEAVGIDAESLGEPEPEAMRVLGTEAVVACLVRDQGLVMPEGTTVGAPMAAERPARQRLAGVPLALAEVEETTRRKRRPQTAQEDARALALADAERLRVPLGAVHVVDRHEGGLAAEREAHVERRELRVDGAAEHADLGPLGVAVGLRHARVLVHAADGVSMVELDLALVDGAGDGRRAHGVGCAGERDVALAREQARGRIESDPASAGDVHLRPGVQVGEVLLRAGGSVERLLVRRELHEVA